MSGVRSAFRTMSCRALHSSSVRSGSPISSRRLAFELVLTSALLIVLTCGTLFVGPSISGTPQQKPTATVLIAALLPVGVLLFLSFVERLFNPAGPRKSLARWFLHLQIYIFSAFMAGVAGVLGTIAASGLTRQFGFNLGLIDISFADGRGVLPLIGALWVSAVVTDFFFYWYHRTLHWSPVLWQVHKLHHMDTELDVLTIGRENWIDAFVASAMITVPASVFFKFDGPDLLSLGLVGGTIASVFPTLLTLGHANLRIQVGNASMFYCSPQVHRIHHSRLPQHRDKNFAFVFPIWDVLFGTYYRPDRDEFPPTGVDGEKEIESFWEAQIFVPREWWKMARARRNARTRAPI